MAPETAELRRNDVKIGFTREAAPEVGVAGIAKPPQLIEIDGRQQGRAPERRLLLNPWKEQRPPAGLGVTALSSPERVTKDTVRDARVRHQADAGQCGASHSTRDITTLATTRR